MCGSKLGELCGGADRFLARVAGEGNDLLHRFLQFLALASLAAVAVAGIAAVVAWMR